VPKTAVIVFLAINSFFGFSYKRVFLAMIKIIAIKLAKFLIARPLKQATGSYFCYLHVSFSL